jgi:hypothetical protein
MAGNHLVPKADYLYHCGSTSLAQLLLNGRFDRPVRCWWTKPSKVGPGRYR